MAYHHYFPHTPDDVEAMLSRCGLSGFDQLYADVPPELLLRRDYDLPHAMSEVEVRDYFQALGDANRQLICFAGAGYYDHYTPAVVPALLQRSEFLTAYTPYQPEISQGTLQYIFEYQSMMATLTGLEVSNASMYDGATAAAEAMMMMVAAARRRTRVLASATLLPQVRAVMSTYAHYHGIDLVLIPEADGMTDRHALAAMLVEGNVAGVVVATPNRFGILEDFAGLADEAHAAGALLAMYANPSALAVIRTPGEWGADIACGDAQPLGMPLNFGGPYLGFLCCRKPLMRKLPGRIVGATTDAKGQRAFVLTLQAREQHIRREKATSNICSNQGLMALHATIYLALMGPVGMREVNEASAANARRLLDLILASRRARLAFPDAPWLHEFLLVTDDPVDLIFAAAIPRGILPGVKVDDHRLLVAATEMRSQADIQVMADLFAPNSIS